MDTFNGVVLLLGLCAAGVWARPNGAPVDDVPQVCVSLQPGARGHPQTQSTGPNPYSIDIVGHQVTYNPGEVLRVRINTGRTHLRGLLMQARRSDGTPVGVWTRTAANTKAVGCTAQNDTVTHSQPTEKRTPIFEWTAPDRDAGQLYFVATLAQEQWIYWLNVRSDPFDYRAPPDPCASGPCRNGGTCINTGTAFRCSCRSGYAGRLCETFTPGPSPPSTGQGQYGNVDLLFIMDTSNGAVNDRNGRGAMQQFMSTIASKLCNSNVGVISYGETVLAEQPWGSVGDQTASQLSNLRLTGKGATRTHLAFDLAISNYFQNPNDPSQRNPNYAILVSEGPAPGGFRGQYQDACRRLTTQRNFQKLIIVGNRAGASADSFRNDICPQGTPVEVIIIDNFNQLNQRIAEVERQLPPCSSQSNACSSRPCLNGGACVTSGSSFQCQCASGWTGRTCSQRTQADPCNPNPCRNSGRCSRSGSSFFCSCVGGFTGQTCDQRPGQNPCNPNPCRNFGQCRQLSQSTFDCNCINGYTGSTCDTPPGQNNICTLQYCMNGGTCRSLPTSRRCDCPQGFRGTRCEQRDITVPPTNEVIVLLRLEESDGSLNQLTQENSGKDRLDWKVTSRDGKPAVGPRVDASEYSTSGAYAYILADRNRNYLGENARYVMQPIQQTGAMCMEFRYFMNGDGDRLRVLKQMSNGQVVGLQELWGSSRNKKWLLSQLSLEESSPGFRLIFEAVPSTDYSNGQNLIALDFIQITAGGFCDPIDSLGPFYRIVGGPTTLEGRVEVSRTNSSNMMEWGGLCRDGFGTLEAQMLCEALFPGSESLFGFKPGRTITLPFYGQPGSGFMALDGIDCTNAEELGECMTSGWRETQCTLEESAAVRCDQPEFYYVGEEMRLNDYVLDPQAGTFTGRLELLYNVNGQPQWGTVCNQGFGQAEAQAVCDTIGFKGQATVSSNSGTGQGTGPVFGFVSCPPRASDLTLCFTAQTFASTTTCPHFQDVVVTCRFETRNVPYNCGFENSNSINGPNCGLYMASNNDFEWTVGPPPVGRARNGRNVMYAQVQGTGSSNPMVDADSSVWITPVIEAFPTTDFLCLRFWYMPYDIRNLQRPQTPFTVYLKMGRQNIVQLWLDPDIGVNRQWTEFTRTLKGEEVNAPVKVAFKANKVASGYIMVDDITVTQGSCSGAGYITRGGGGGSVSPMNPNTGGGGGGGGGTGGTCSSTNIPRSFAASCDFETQQCLDDTLQTVSNQNNNLDWVRGQVTPSSGTGPTSGFGPPNAQTYFFIFLEASNVDPNSYTVARFTYAFQRNQMYCVSFDYHMYGEHINRLALAMSGSTTIQSNDGGRSDIFQLQGQKSRQWNPVQVDVQMGSSMSLFLIGVRGSLYQGDVSVDNLRVRQQQCCPTVCARSLGQVTRGNPNIYNCEFGNTFEACCFRNCPDGVPSDSNNWKYSDYCPARGQQRIQWVRLQANEQSLDSRTNYPRQTGQNDYYLGAVGGPNEVARLFTGSVDLSSGSVYLRMNTYFSSSTATIEVGVIVNGRTITPPINTFRAPNGRTSTRWQEVCVQIDNRSGSMVNVYIDGAPSSSGTVFIDDINLSSTRCN